MAVAAYASLLSLAHTLDQQAQHPVHRLHTEQLRSLQEKVMHLQHFLEHHSQSKISQEVEDVEGQIPVVANEAEDVIDSHVVSQWASKDTSSSDHDAAAALSSFYQDVDEVIQKVDSIVKELMEVVVKEELNDVKEPKLIVDSLPTNATSSRVLLSSGENSTMVGFDDRLVQIIDELTRDESDLKILPIVGMGGSKDPYLMGFLDEQNCWNLLCVKAFGEEVCPYSELEQIGRDIATLYVKTDDDKSKIVLPSEIWTMPQLRHINITWAVLPDPDPVDAKDHTTTILENLQNLSVIQKFKCAKKVVEKIPNLKELQVNYPYDLSEWSIFQLHNLAHLHKLESLSLNATKFPLKSITFPTSLKKLVLEHCEIPWEDMTVIGSLPNLEVLKLRYHASSGPEWNPVVGEFLRLKFLLIESGELVRWTAEDVHFPSLEVLIMESMRNVGEIHSSIGDIATLKLIQLRYCFGDIENSAKQILEEQRSNGNESLQVVIGGISL
ncbi:UNVERIFIED_CONTAM: hypothetical protein Scaly_0393000 [Sesamum calycinum]|uniref:Uncharacterized protein n=1 Tax=Sesamum calycinum TaxID=2727403 RepID=A0AAW2SD39_9LAMI